MRPLQATLLLLLAGSASLWLWQALAPLALAGATGLLAAAAALQPCVAWSAAGIALPLVGAALGWTRGRGAGHSCARRDRAAS